MAFSVAYRCQEIPHFRHDEVSQGTLRRLKSITTTMSGASKDLHERVAASPRYELFLPL